MLMLAGLLLAALPASAAAAHWAATDIAATAVQTDPVQSSCHPGDARGMPCCQASACTTLAVPASATQSVIVPAERDVVRFIPLRPQWIAGIAPHPGMRPPRAAA